MMFTQAVAACSQRLDQTLAELLQLYGISDVVAALVGVAGCSNCVGLATEHNGSSIRALITRLERQRVARLESSALAYRGTKVEVMIGGLTGLDFRESQLLDDAALGTSNRHSECYQRIFSDLSLPMTCGKFRGTDASAQSMDLEFRDSRYYRH